MNQVLKEKNRSKLNHKNEKVLNLIRKQDESEFGERMKIKLSGSVNSMPKRPADSAKLGKRQLGLVPPITPLIRQQQRTSTVVNDSKLQLRIGEEINNSKNPFLTVQELLTPKVQASSRLDDEEDFMIKLDELSHTMFSPEASKNLEVKSRTSRKRKKAKEKLTKIKSKFSKKIALIIPKSSNPKLAEPYSHNSPRADSHISDISDKEIEKMPKEKISIFAKNNINKQLTQNRALTPSPYRSPLKGFESSLALRRNKQLKVTLKPTKVDSPKRSINFI